jgi:hypothetical protein
VASSLSKLNSFFTACNRTAVIHSNSGCGPPRASAMLSCNLVMHAQFLALPAGGGASSPHRRHQAQPLGLHLQLQGLGHPGEQGHITKHQPTTVADVCLQGPQTRGVGLLPYIRSCADLQVPHPSAQPEWLVNITSSSPELAAAELYPCHIAHILVTASQAAGHGRSCPEELWHAPVACSCLPCWHTSGCYVSLHHCQQQQCP